MQRTALLSQFCPSVCPSVHPSVRCVYCDKTKQRTANILISHETVITLVFWHQQWLVGDAPFPLKSALKVTHPPSKNAAFGLFALAKPLFTPVPTYTAWWQRHKRVNNLPKVVAPAVPERESNPRLLDRLSDALPVASSRHPKLSVYWLYHIPLPSGKLSIIWAQ